MSLCVDQWAVLMWVCAFWVCNTKTSVERFLERERPQGQGPPSPTRFRSPTWILGNAATISEKLVEQGSFICQ